MTDRIQHRKLYEQVVERIKSDVHGARLKPGDQLPNERLLGERFGVSRTVIREAVKTLVEIGLVEVRRGQGTFVVDGTANALKQSMRLMLSFAPGDRADEMVEIRELLEPEIAALAAERRRDDDLEDLRKAIADMDASLDDSETFIEADNRFHLALAKATHNHVLPHLLDSVVDLLQELRGQIFTVRGGPQRGQGHHAAILAAVAAGDPEAARAAMLAHLEQVRRDGHRAVDGLQATPQEGAA